MFATTPAASLLAPLADEASRIALLEELLERPEQATDLSDRLRPFPWDSDEELVTLKASHLLTAMRRYSEGGLTAEQTRVWAEALEVRDDIGIDGTCTDLIRDTIFELANPELEGRLSSARANQLVRRLAACAE